MKQLLTKILALSSFLGLISLFVCYRSGLLKLRYLGSHNGGALNSVSTDSTLTFDSTVTDIKDSGLSDTIALGNDSSTKNTVVPIPRELSALNILASSKSGTIIARSTYFANERLASGINRSSLFSSSKSMLIADELPEEWRFYEEWRSYLETKGSISNLIEDKEQRSDSLKSKDPLTPNKIPLVEEDKKSQAQKMMFFLLEVLPVYRLLKRKLKIVPINHSAI